MTNGAPIPIVFAIDVEPDDRFVDKRMAPSWTGFEKLHDHVSALRQRISSRMGVTLRFSWFLRMDPQIQETYGDAAWPAIHYADRIDAMIEAQDALGLHVHAFRWDSPRGDWLVDHGNREWVQDCVRVSADAFERSIHRPCRAYRMGDRYLDDSLLAHMESLGGRVDLTVEPGYGGSRSVFLEEPHTGSLPDFSTAPILPYRPSHCDFRRPAESDHRALSILPLSTWKLPTGMALARRVYASALRLRQRMPEVLTTQRMVTCATSLPDFLFRRAIDGVLARPTPYLASIDRTHVGNDPEKLNRIERNLQYLLSHPLAPRFAFVGPEESIDLLRDER
jgi:hypothetical protein